MKSGLFIVLAAWIAVLAYWLCGGVGAQSAEKAEPAEGKRGQAKATDSRPTSFPHRIWAASDFEKQSFLWFGTPQTANIPTYAGNKTSLAALDKPFKPTYRMTSALMTGMNPIPGTRIGKVNKLYLRYYLTGATEATFQHFNLDKGDNQHIRVAGLTEGKWTELTLNFTRDAQRNSGKGPAFADGDRMDDFKVFVGKPSDGKQYQLFIDDVIFFSEDPNLPAEPEPFPRRVLFYAAFDTGLKQKDKLWPGDFDLVNRDLPKDSHWYAARAVPKKDDAAKVVHVRIDPPRPAGPHTKLRFRYHVHGASALAVELINQGDKRVKVDVKDLKQDAWTFTYVDFQAAAAQSLAEESMCGLSFVVPAEVGKDVALFIDEIVLYDAGQQ